LLQQIPGVLIWRFFFERPADLRLESLEFVVVTGKTGIAEGHAIAGLH
jgi:hypothetical protein